MRCFIGGELFLAARLFAAQGLAADRVVLVAAPAVVAPAATAASTPAALLVLFVVVVALGACVRVDQRLPVGDRDLIVVGMDFAERQEAVAVAAVFDERGLERRLNARHLGKIDISAKLFSLRRLEIKFFNSVAAQNDDPGFLRMRRIDKHFVGH